MSQFTTDQISDIIRRHYSLQTIATKLVGELDLNFQLSDGAGNKYCFKISHLGEAKAHLEMQHAAMVHVYASDPELSVPRVVKAVSGEDIISVNDAEGNLRFARLLTWIEGNVFADVRPHTSGLLCRYGSFCGRLCKALSDFDHPAAHRFIKWDPNQTLWIKDSIHLFTGSRAEVASYFLELFESKVLPRHSELRKSVNYNDANDYNVLVGGSADDRSISGVIDFGDLVFTQTINELAIAIAYAVMKKPDPLEAACHLVRGFHAVFPIQEVELETLYSLVGARLLISVTCSAINRKAEPENVYLQISDGTAWDLLLKWKDIHPDFAYYAFRNACGQSPVPLQQHFNELQSKIRTGLFMPVPNVDAASQWLDCSIESPDLGTMHDIADPHLLAAKLSQAIASLGGASALGRYGEARPFYTTDEFIEAGNDKQRWRTKHLGIDFFGKVGTEVRAVWEGTIHSFANNNRPRDYGPTLILEHVVDGITFYSIYGHLSVDSMQEWRRGRKVSAGEYIGCIGSFEENGHWSPHLHFQLSLNLFNQVGNYPGVSSPEYFDVWRSVSPDPWNFLTGKECPTKERLEKDDIIAYRKEHLGKNLSISYREPIVMMRGHGQYLLDHEGRKFLDTVNNVAHVGHEHPSVVLAGQRQMAVLNTNTRYLHENLVKFTEALLKTLPPSLDVAFMVNSGSEANELAVRLAKNYTGGQDMVVSQIGYHGNTNVCVEISSYKFDGPGGKGALPHIHVVPIPDVYRGLYRDTVENPGARYASHVEKAVQEIQSSGKKLAALIFESVISCGGQVELPAGFLKQSYDVIRKNGGVCIADEVQTGCGRMGDHYWAFEAHGVTPDIVTIGKPIGNGHPLGVVVTTQKIADAFKNGMEYFNTFGGNPVSCAIGQEVLKIIREEGLQENANRTGGYLKAGLMELKSRFPVIGDVRGSGFFLGFELVENPETRMPATAKASWLANRMREKSILMSTDGPFNNVLKIKPPMVFSSIDADFLLHSIEEVLGEDFMQLK
ncbi:MAG: aminotransferase class III-fold pyridoxal phosphate-dependent enzyme [Bacteroidetes bacterium]|nr:aminotransferase class III-fold pyridoxal phosphate-dependent enzyme [Bacteroidota bacterium]